MKKLILSTAILLGALTAVTAQEKKLSTMDSKETKVETKVETQTNNAKDLKSAQSSQVKQTKLTTSKAVQNYKQVQLSEVPQVVTDAVARDFDGASISGAYINAQGDYKIELSTADNKKATAYSNSKGEWIKNN